MSISTHSDKILTNHSNDVLNTIFDKLDLPSLCKVGQTCKKFQKLVNKDKYLTKFKDKYLTRFSNIIEDCKFLSKSYNIEIKNLNLLFKIVLQIKNKTKLLINNLKKEQISISKEVKEYNKKTTEINLRTNPIFGTPRIINFNDISNISKYDSLATNCRNRITLLEKKIIKLRHFEESLKNIQL